MHGKQCAGLNEIEASVPFCAGRCGIGFAAIDVKERARRERRCRNGNPRGRRKMGDGRRPSLGHPKSDFFDFFDELKRLTWSIFQSHPDRRQSQGVGEACRRKVVWLNREPEGMVTERHAGDGEL